MEPPCIIKLSISNFSC